MNLVTINTGDYAPHWITNTVHALAARHISIDLSHYCITDNPDGLDSRIIPINPNPNWPGLWNKIHLYGPLMPYGRFVFLDLDLLILKDITDIIAGYTGDLCGDEDHLHFGAGPFSNHPEYGRIDCSYGSAFVMGKAEANREVYDTFKAAPDKHMRAFRRHGDQVFTSWAKKGQFDLIERLHPKTHGFYSYRFNILGDAPANVINKAKVSHSQCRFINFHGQPKWWQLMEVHPWIKQATQSQDGIEGNTPSLLAHPLAEHGLERMNIQY